MRTGRDAFYAAPDYMIRGPGVTAEATHWLFDRGVRVMGIDAWGWDVPLNLEAAEAKARNETGIFWAAHQADLPYSQIERLVNLDQLPPDGFRVACFPLKLEAGQRGARPRRRHPRRLSGRTRATVPATRGACRPGPPSSRGCVPGRGSWPGRRP